MLQQAKTVARVARSGLTPGKPLSLVYLVTMKCNARCKMCLYWKEVFGPESKGRTTLTLEQIDTFTKSMGRLLQMQVGGGEPFIRGDMGEIMLTMIRNCRPLMYTMSTNGSFPHRIVPAVDAACTEFPQTMLRINLSIDGYGELHDDIRKLDGLYEKCRETMAGLKKLQEKHKNLTVNLTLVLSKYNLEGIEETVDKMREDLCPNHFLIMMARGDTPEKEALEVPLEEYERIVEKVRRDMESEGTRYHPLQKLGRVLEMEVSDYVARTLKEKRQVVSCVGGSKHIMIDDDGSILPCDILKPFLLHNPTEELDSPVMARLSDHDFSVPKALASASARKVAKFIEDGKCWCTSECLMTPSVLLRPKGYPRMAARALKMLMQELSFNNRPRQTVKPAAAHQEEALPTASER